MSILCKFCSEDISANPYWNDSRTVSACKSCWEERYFFCPIDRRTRLKKSGVLCDDGKYYSEKYVQEYTSLFSGLKFMSACPAEVYYWEGGRRVRGYYNRKERPEIANNWSGYPILKRDMIVADCGRRLHKDEAELYRCTDAITGKSFISTNPIKVYYEGTTRVVSKASYEDLISKGLLNVCIICGADTSSKINNALGQFESDLDDVVKFAANTEVVRDYSIGRKRHHICERCISYIFPLSFNSIKSTTGTGRTIGIEFECEPTIFSQIQIFKWRDSNGGFMVTSSRDGSLRGPFPSEYKSPILYESNYEEWVNEFCSRLKARVYNRCGLHIHIGTGDLGWWELSNLMRYCHKFESWFMSIVSPSRVIGLDGNNSGSPMRLPWEFSIPFQSKENIMKALYGKSKLSAEEIGNRRANDGDGPRYTGCIHRYQWLNMHGHFHKKAIEIRLHQGTANSTKVNNWIRLWLCIIKHASKNPSLWVPPQDAIPSDLRAYYEERARLFENNRTKLINPM